ncbi:MAG TPA: PAS domain S-box protein, partial [Thermoanaerobaculia bacterium]
GIVAAELAAEIAERDRKVLRRNEPVETTDCQIDPRDPHARPHYWKSVFFPFSNNRGDRFVGTIAFEITDLVEAEVATHEARLKLQAVIENMQEGIVIFDLKGALLQSNRAAFEMQGFAPGDEPKSMTDIARDVEISTVDGRPLTAEERPQSRLMRGEPLRDMVIRLTRRDSDWCRILNLSGSIVAYEHHQSLGFITMRDITESIEATEALRHSEAKASAILSSLTEGIVVLDMNGNVVSLNAAAQRLLGRTMAEFQDPITYPRARVIRVDGTPMPLDELPSTIALKFGRGTRDVEMGVPRPDGSMAWLSSSAELIRDAAGVATGVVVSLFDITGRREADRSLRNAAERMQSLSHRLLDIQETERRQLAVELHDEIGQALTAVKINLQSLQRFPEPAALERRLEDSVSVVNRALNQVRSLSLQLRPALLDDLGLAAALRWLADQHAQRADLVLHFIDAVGDRRYAPALEIASFRIAQEAMNNVMRHADARELTVELLEEEGTLHVRIRDDGKGFDVEAARIRASGAASMGMLGMEERALLASGRIEWISNAGKGTEVHVSFPVEAAA